MRMPEGSALGEARPTPRTYVYVDGFNLFYSSLHDAPEYRWLDLGKLARILLPASDILLIRYFTAPIRARLAGPESVSRQQAYWRTLRTIPHLVRHGGQFQVNRATRDLVDPPATGPRRVFVCDAKEKGSDVNLATHLLVDGFLDRYDVAAVISNDSDLAPPVQMVRDVLRKAVGVIIPLPVKERRAHPETEPGEEDVADVRRPSRRLREAASFVKTIRESALAQAQFPDVVTDRKGRIVRPAAWRAETPEEKARAASLGAAPRPTDEAIGDVPQE
jgi:hypothetical protein